MGEWSPQFSLGINIKAKTTVMATDYATAVAGVEEALRPILAAAGLEIAQLDVMPVASLPIL